MATKKTSAVGKKRTPALLSKYRALQRAKKSLCAGRATQAAVNAKKTAYVKAAVAKGQTKVEATRKADRVLKAGCSSTKAVSGTRRKRTVRVRAKSK